MGKFLGIDFGTTNSVAAVCENGKAVALKIDDNNSREILRSVLYFDQKHHGFVGKQSVDKYLWDVENLPALPPVRKHTGRMLKVVGDSTASGFGGMKLVPEIVEIDESGRGRLLQSLKSVLANGFYKGTDVFSKIYMLEELLAILMRELKERAESLSGVKYSNAVIGRPVKYVGENANEQLALERMRKIAELAGFEKVVFEYEPVGAALNFGVDISEPSNILVFDFGGGTLDVCVMKLPDREILAVAGRPIGGDLLSTQIFNDKLLPYFGSQVTLNNGNLDMPRHLMMALSNWYSIVQLKTKDNIDSLDELIIKADQKQPVQNLRNLILSDSGFKIYQEIDKAKIGLSDNNEARIRFSSKELEIDEPVDRSEFERMIRPQLEQSADLLDEVLELAKLDKTQIDVVITTGGSSNIPIFKKLLTDYFGENKVRFGESFVSVAKGLAIRAEQEFAGSM
jgi:hypothetical chaperone protein